MYIVASQQDFERQVKNVLLAIKLSDRSDLAGWFLSVSAFLFFNKGDFSDIEPNTIMFMVST